MYKGWSTPFVFLFNIFLLIKKWCNIVHTTSFWVVIDIINTHIISFNLFRKSRVTCHYFFSLPLFSLIHNVVTLSCPCFMTFHIFTFIPSSHIVATLLLFFHSQCLLFHSCLLFLLSPLHLLFIHHKVRILTP